MRKYLKRKMAMCLLAASLFNKSQNSNAMVRNIQNNCQNKQTGMSQMVKIGVAAGLTAGLLSLGVVIPLTVINSKVAEKELEGKMYQEKMCQENKVKLQNLFNEQAKKCEIKSIENIQKYWNALNKIAQESWDDVLKKAIDKRLGKNPKDVRFNNINYYSDCYSDTDMKSNFVIYLAGIDDYIDSKVTSYLPIADAKCFEERLNFKSILNEKKIISIYPFIVNNLRDLKEIINGTVLPESLEIESIPNGVEFRFKEYVDKSELGVRIYRQAYLNTNSIGKDYGDFISIKRKYNEVVKDSLVLEFADSEKDFGLEF